MLHPPDRDRWQPAHVSLLAIASTVGGDRNLNRGRRRTIILGRREKHAPTVADVNA